MRNTDSVSAQLVHSGGKRLKELVEILLIDITNIYRIAVLRNNLGIELDGVGNLDRLVTVCS